MHTYVQTSAHCKQAHGNCFKPLSDDGSFLTEKTVSSCSTFSDFKRMICCTRLWFSFCSKVLALMRSASTLFSLRNSCSGVSSVEPQNKNKTDVIDLLTHHLSPPLSHLPHQGVVEVGPQEPTLSSTSPSDQPAHSSPSP